MDCGKDYILMCKKAEEIQTSRLLIQKEFGDVFHSNGEKVIWLPRQDQLQEMLLNNFVQEEGGYLPTYWLLHKFEQWLPDCRYVATSMEQLWLAFVMKEKYQKVWNGEDWVKD